MKIYLVLGLALIIGFLMGYCSGWVGATGIQKLLREIIEDKLMACENEKNELLEKLNKKYGIKWFRTPPREGG